MYFRFKTQYKIVYIYFVCCVCRSSDSTKYGTNKSSGASVTSGNHQKHQLASGTHDSVSTGKPPMHPNHHHTNHNHRTTSIPVHNNSNNRLINNTIFQNNQYTFSLSPYDDSGYLESRPLSSASLYGDGQRVTRGTKSDIGVPCHRQSSSKALLHNSSVHTTNNSNSKAKSPSVKSDFLLSYLNNNNYNHNNSNSKNMINNNDYNNSQTHAQSNDHSNININNNSDINDCTNSSAYRISGVTTSDYLETYKTGAKRLYASSSKLEHIDMHPHPSTINEQQRNRIINFVNRNQSANDSNTKPIVGPLLYLDSNTVPSQTNQNHFDVQHKSIQSVSKSKTKLNA